jgi:hypothetical protein
MKMMKLLQKQTALFVLALSLPFVTGCATSYLKGATPQGEKVYLGPLPIENTEAYRTYIQSPRTEVDKQNYLFARMKDADKLEFLHDGSWYNSVEAYRGGKWLMRHRYQKDQNTRDFIHKYVERSEDTGKYHLAKYPDGSVHIGSYLLYNELDLLEETEKKNSRDGGKKVTSSSCGEKCAGS